MTKRVAVLVAGIPANARWLSIASFRIRKPRPLNRGFTVLNGNSVAIGALCFRVWVSAVAGLPVCGLRRGCLRLWGLGSGCLCRHGRGGSFLRGCGLGSGCLRCHGLGGSCLHRCGLRSGCLRVWGLRSGCRRCRCCYNVITHAHGSLSICRPEPAIVRGQ